MNGRYILGTVALLLFLSLVGCQGARTTGKDPLLGKTRLDPPSTSARSVYIERPNIHDSGVVPGNRRALASSSSADAKKDNSSSSAGISNASGASRHVRYPTDLDGANFENTQDTTANSSYLRWISAPVPMTQNENERNAETAPNGQYLDAPTESELRAYQYIYDFSSYPPRPRAIRKSSETSVKPNQPTVALLPDTSALGKIQPKLNASPVSPRPRNAQFFSSDFDPYAPNRTYERKRMALSRDMETIFDQEPTPKFINEQNANRSQVQNTTPTLPVPTLSQSVVAQPTLIARNSISATGWQVVATPSCADVQSSPDTEIAPKPASINIAVGTQIALPPEKKATQIPHQRDAVLHPDNAINILDLPER